MMKLAMKRTFISADLIHVTADIVDPDIPTHFNKNQGDCFF